MSSRRHSADRDLQSLHDTTCHFVVCKFSTWQQRDCGQWRLAHGGKDSQATIPQVCYVNRMRHWPGSRLMEHQDAWAEHHRVLRQHQPQADFFHELDGWIIRRAVKYLTEVVLGAGRLVGRLDTQLELPVFSGFEHTLFQHFLKTAAA